MRPKPGITITASRFDPLDALKLLALAAMTVDHVNAALLARASESMTLIGRIAFPVFVFAAAAGALRTHAPRRYLSRLLLCALISQPPFWLTLAIDGWHLNTVFTLLLGVAAVLAWRMDRPWLAPLALLPALICDYGWAGAAAVPAAALLLGNDWRWRLLGGCALTALSPLLWLTPAHLIVGLATCGAMLLALSRAGPPPPSPSPRYGFYVYYPLHLAVLALIKYL